MLIPISGETPVAKVIYDRNAAEVRVWIDRLEAGNRPLRYLRSSAI